MVPLLVGSHGNARTCEVSVGRFQLRTLEVEDEARVWRLSGVRGKKKIAAKKKAASKWEFCVCVVFAAASRYY